MGRYSGIDCPMCEKPLENGGEVVVCPDCGAPYHKQCYLNAGICAFPKLHESGESWEPPAPSRTPEEIFDGAASLRCPRCGTVNPSSGIFCQVCGNKLNDKTAEAAESGASAVPGYPPQAQQSGVPPFGAGFYPPEMPLNPFTTPYGGVAPDEEIDDIPAKDLAIFVGRNSHYFLPRFKEISTGRGKAVNWSAFLFTGGYYLYRKMYLPAAAFLLAELVFSLPRMALELQRMSQGMSFMDGTAAPSTLLTISYVCSLLSMALRFACGFFANSLYQKHCKKKILQEKALERSEDEYLAALSRKGGIATKLITGILIGYAVLNIVCFYMIILSGGLV